MACYFCGTKAGQECVHSPHGYVPTPQRVVPVAQQDADKPDPAFELVFIAEEDIPAGALVYLNVHTGKLRCVK